jgi:4-hydroxy-2-oxoheptanedioate aldolase
MRKNKVKDIWAAGGEVVTGWLGIPSSISAELMAQQGWDALTIDLQHGATDYVDAVPMLQAISTTDTTPMVRVPWNDPAIIGKVLDAGAYGVICPMVNSAEEADAFVKACRYFPKGGRSVGPLRASLYAGADYFQHANDTIITMAMIETQEAMDNLDAILSTPGLDSIYVGPADLGLSLVGIPAADPTHETTRAAIRTIAEACKRHKVAAGIHCYAPLYAKEMISWGYNFVTLASDNALLANMAKATVAAMREGAAEGGKGLY